MRWLASSGRCETETTNLSHFGLLVGMPDFVRGWTYVAYNGPVKRWRGRTSGMVGTVSFQVAFVEDGDLPERVDWVLAADERGRMFFVKRSRVCPEVLREAWAASTQLSSSSSPTPVSA